MPSATKSNICFFFETPVSLRNRTQLKEEIVRIFKRHGKKPGSLNFIFCTDKRLLEINRQYLQHDYYTDIITFELNAPGQPVEGEIYISIDRVKDNARQLGQPIYRELHRVIFHGVLHLSGFGDKTDAQEAEMRRQEDLCLKRYLK
ncbi:MAG: rRNA maturation RNase YbeY [Chitinophagaceae bacterium]|nr:rRNA maturation RNase YbeY [Chitinophagaceae bacterium]